MKLQVITHCYCPPGLEHYANALVWHFGSLCAHPGSKFESIKLTVCYTGHDKATEQTIAGFGFADEPSNVMLEPIAFSREELFRRAIGRNYVAKQTDADVVHFADTDYIYGPGFLDAIHDHFANGAEFIYPRKYKINVDHETGDRMLEQSPDEWFSIDQSKFKPTGLRKAIGGLMFVSGDVARRGYLDGSRKWMKPVDPSQGFQRCHCDTAYRRSLLPNTFKGVDAQWIYRLRHTENGREFNAKGEKRA